MNNRTMIFFIKGGYCLQQLNVCGSACVATLLGDVPVRCSENAARYPQELVYVDKRIHQSISVFYLVR